MELELNKLIIAKWMEIFGYRWRSSTLTKLMEGLCLQLKVLGVTFKNKEHKLCTNKSKQNLIQEFLMIYRFLLMKENLNSALNSIQKVL